MQATHLTVGQVAKSLGLPAWRVRRIVDTMGATIPRAGLYRLIPSNLLGTIAVEANRRGWLPTTEARGNG